MIGLGRRRKSKSAHLVPLLSIFLAVFFLVLAFPAIPEALTFTGKVILTDPTEKTLAIEPLTGDLKGNVFALAENVTVIMGSRKLSFEEIIVGDRVAVNYYRQDGINIIDGIEIAPPIPEDRKYILIRKPSERSNVTPSGIKQQKTNLLPPF
jgi:hypothetical protein